MENEKEKGATFLLLLITGLLLVQCATVQTTSTEAANTPRSVLFVGNSLVAYPTGQNTLLRMLASSESPPREIEADLAIAEGKVLEALWSDPSDRYTKILSGKYDVVVLQGTLSRTGIVYGGLTADTETKFHEYVAMFDEEIRKGGGQTVLFMHWQFNEDGAIQSRISLAYMRRLQPSVI